MPSAPPSQHQLPQDGAPLTAEVRPQYDACVPSAPADLQRRACVLQHNQRLGGVVDGCSRRAHSPAELLARLRLKLLALCGLAAPRASLAGAHRTGSGPTVRGRT
eukprot:394787-Pyramimonas_sp.AAC.1